MSIVTPNNPAMIVHEKYPHTGNLYPLTPDSLSEGYGMWYEHALPNGRLAVAVWLYESSNYMRRTVIVQEWNNPEGEVYVAKNVWLGAACSYKTLEFMDKIAAL